MSEPNPQLDPRPPENPGGVDAVDHAAEVFPPVVPDPPVSAQLEDIVPDVLQQPDDKVQEGRDSDPPDNAAGSDDPG